MLCLPRPSACHLFHYLLAGLILLLITSPGSADPVTNQKQRPNFVFIFADDLGYADLSSYGSTTIDTPQLDALAANGVKFTEFYSVSQVCSPSRAALLTGRYPVRSGVNAVYFHDTMDGLPPEEITIAEILRDAGYRTGIVGKWHLGHLDRFMPWNQGFESFYGVPYSNDMRNFYLYDNQEILYEAVDQRYLTRNYTERALQFIDQHQSEPFFLYIAHTMPHVPLYVSPEFSGKSKGGIYGDVVEELDWSVGEVVKKLRELNLLDNTLIVFSSDNGPWLAMRDHGGSAGHLRHGKTTSFEGGQKVPTIAHWPAGIKTAQESTTVANMMDWLPTFAELAGAPLPTDRVIDGRTLAAELQGVGQREATPFFYFKMRIPVLTSSEAELAGVRDGDWKLKLAYDGLYPEALDHFIRAGRFSHPTLLFNLREDPGEQNNLAASHPDEVARLTGLIEDFENSAPAGRATLGTATGKDDSDHNNLIKGVLMAAAIVLLPVLFALIVIVRWVRRLIKRR